MTVPADTAEWRRLLLHDVDAFNRAIDDVTEVAERLIASLVATTPPRDRDEWAARAKARAAERYGVTAR